MRLSEYGKGEQSARKLVSGPRDRIKGGDHEEGVYRVELTPHCKIEDGGRIESIHSHSAQGEEEGVSLTYEAED